MRSNTDPEALAVKKDIKLLTQALKRGGTYSYPEKVNLVFQSSFLTLPFLFVNAIFIFLDTRKKLEQGMYENFYYNHYFHKLIPTLALEGSIIGSEAMCITTASVILANILTIPTAVYQGIRYRRYQQEHREEMTRLVALLKQHHYADAERLHYYGLTHRQIGAIRSLIGSDALTQNSVIAGKPSSLNQFFSDLNWVSAQSHKYISPFLPLTLIPGFILMQGVAANLSEDLNCKPLPLLALFFDYCSPIERVELMSLLAYAWGCFSGTYLVMHTFALASRLALAPFPGLRRVFHEYVNAPFTEWVEENQFEQLFKKVFLALMMPPAAAFSLSSCLKFTETYLAETGCTAAEAFSRAFFTGPSYPCSTTQASLGVSVFIGAFEFEHLYPIYMSICLLAQFAACWSKFKLNVDSSALNEAAKDQLDKLAFVEKKLLLGLGIGAIAGGVFGLWPALQMSNAILRKEGVEIFFPLTNFSIPDNHSYPDLSPTQSLPFDVNELIASVPECTISAPVNLPPIDLGNHSFPGMNISVPCIEIFFDPVSNQSILGMQITPPCPDLSPLSVYGANLFHIPLSCDPILQVRAMAGFVAPYWLSVNAGGSLGLSIASLLVCFSFFRRLCCSAQRPELAVQTPLEDAKSEFQPDLELARLQPEEKLEEGEEEEKQEHANCWTGLRRRVHQFFSSPPLAANQREAPTPQHSPSHRPLLSLSRTE